MCPLDGSKFPRNLWDFDGWLTSFPGIFNILFDAWRFFLGICGNFRDLTKFAPWMVQNFLGICGILMDG